MQAPMRLTKADRAKLAKIAEGKAKAIETSNKAARATRLAAAAKAEK